MTRISDADLNEDWMRALHWDMQGVEHLYQLFEALGVGQAADEDRAVALRRFMELAAWLPSPDAIKSEAATWLAARRGPLRAVVIRHGR